MLHLSEDGVDNPIGDNTPLRVGAVVVTFHPDQAQLQGLLKAISGQVDLVVIVDNGSPRESLAFVSMSEQPGCVMLHRLETNRGIATAQNIGIELLRDQATDYVVLFDQDSLPAPDMILQLLTASLQLQAQGVSVAAVGPRYYDARQDNPPPFIRIEGVRVVRQPCTTAASVVPVSYLIASGCLMPMSTISAVGGMLEPLFIDYVDIEWGLRAGRMGFQSFGVCSATMAHDLGESPLRFRGRAIPLHSPLRHYYHFRNAVYLYRSGNFSWQWKIADGWRLLLKYGYYTLYAQPRLSHWWMMTLGMLDGLRGRMGKYSGRA